MNKFFEKYFKSGILSDIPFVEIQKVNMVLSAALSKKSIYNENNDNIIVCVNGGYDIVFLSYNISYKKWMLRSALKIRKNLSSEDYYFDNSPWKHSKISLILEEVKKHNQKFLVTI